MCAVRGARASTKFLRCKASGESDTPSTTLLTQRGPPPSLSRGRMKIHTGKLSCFRGGSSTVLVRSMASARAMRERVIDGMMTSSI